LLHDILRANQAEIVILASAINDSRITISYPSAYPEVISVSAIDLNNNIAEFSPIGKIDAVAPGVNIYSTIRDQRMEH